VTRNAAEPLGLLCGELGGKGLPTESSKAPATAYSGCRVGGRGASKGAHSPSAGPAEGARGSCHPAGLWDVPH
jgi:hypothetical protein